MLLYLITTVSNSYLRGSILKKIKLALLLYEVQLWWASICQKSQIQLHVMAFVVALLLFLIKFLLHSPFWTWTLPIAQEVLELKILWAKPPQELMELKTPCSSAPWLTFDTMHFLSLSLTKSTSVCTPVFLLAFPGHPTSFLLFKPHIFIQIIFCSLLFSFLNCHHSRWAAPHFRSVFCLGTDASLLRVYLTSSATPRHFWTPNIISQGFFVFCSDWHKSRHKVGD